jgi:probable HAF family extracellular repeat protein
MEDPMYLRFLLRAAAPAAVLAYLIGPAHATSARAPARPAGLYQPTDLGALPGFESTVVRGINGNGNVVGYCEGAEEEETGAPIVRGFVWNGTAMLPLPTLGGRNSYAYAINSRGEVAGDADAADGRYPVVWRQGARKPGLITGAAGTAVVLNDDGTAAGVDPEGKLVLLGPLAPKETVDFATGAKITVAGINAKGKVVGSMEVEGGSGRKKRAFLLSDGRVEELATLGGEAETPASINSAGQVAGSAQRRDGVWHACLWDGSAALDLSTPPGWSSRGTGINVVGEVVGTATHIESGLSCACLWRNGAVTDLNTLIPPDSGWELLSAEGINDRGDIIGTGRYDGAPAAFYLKAPPRPSPRGHGGIYFCGGPGGGSVAYSPGPVGGP